MYTIGVKLCLNLLQPDYIVFEPSRTRLSHRSAFDRGVYFWWIIGDDKAKQKFTFHQKGAKLNFPPKMPRLVVVSNRLPVTLSKSENGWKYAMSSGGLVSALSGLQKEM